MKKIAVMILAALLLCGCGPVPEEPSQPSVQLPTEDQPELPPEEPKVLSLIAQEALLEEPGQTLCVYNGTAEPEQVSWISEDPAVATVVNGVVTAVGRGQTVITASFEDQRLSCSVVCDLPVMPALNPDAGERDPMYLPPSEQIVDSSFFDDAVFVGDSQGLALYTFAAGNGQLGKAKFLARNSYSLYSAATNTMYMTLRGEEYKLETAIAYTGAKKVFIMLGMNDVGNFETDKIMENYQRVLDRIRKKNPDVDIYIQSIFYAWTGGETKRVNNQAIGDFNSRLPAFAEENNCVFIDIASWLVDSTGGTATAFSSDKYVHINADGMQVWIDALKACTDYD